MADEKSKTQKPEKEKSASANPKLEKIIEAIAQLSVLELSELVKALEEKF